MTAISTKEELSLDVQYGYWFNLMCERFYKHLDLGINVVQLVGGSGAAFAVMNSTPDLMAVVGVLLAASASVSLLIQPAIKAAAHERVKADYTLLMAASRSMNVDELDQAIAQIRSKSPAGPGRIANPAYNAAVQAMGREDAVVKLSFMERLFSAVTG